MNERAQLLLLQSGLMPCACLCVCSVSSSYCISVPALVPETLPLWPRSGGSKLESSLKLSQGSSFNLFTYCVCRGEGAWGWAVCWSMRVAVKKQLAVSSHVGPRDLTRVVGLGGKPLYSLSHLDDSRELFF